MLASTCSIDAFSASFAYGSNKIKIPLLSLQVINLVCSFILGLSLLLGATLRHFLPKRLALTVCFFILFFIGVSKLLDSITKSIIRKHSDLNKQVKFSLFNFRFILQLYADPIEADIDGSRSISPKEAALLAVSLSLDGLAVGFGAAIGNVNVLAVIIASLITDMLAVLLGGYLGNKLAGSLNYNISWLSGAILIAMAFFKLL